jgi:hypothetical protein
MSSGNKANQGKRPRATNKAQKVNAVTSAEKSYFINKLKNQEKIMRHHALNFVDPGCQAPQPFPAKYCHRAAAVHYPVIYEFDPTSEPGYDGTFNAIVKPSLDEPIQVSHLGGVPESQNTVRGNVYAAVSSGGSVSIKVFNADQACQLESTTVAGRPAIPLVSTGGATVTFFVKSAPGNTTTNTWTLSAYNGVVWADLATTSQIGFAQEEDGSVGGIAWAVGYTHFAVRPK